MLNLIFKDLIIQKKNLLYSAIYIIIMIVSFQGAGPENGGTMMVAGVVAVTYVLALSTCAYDEKNNSDIMLNSLPLSRAKIVIAKYISIPVFFAIGLLEYFIIASLVSITKIPLLVSPLTVEGVVGAAASIVVISSIYFPVFFKMGYIKSKLISFIMFFGIFFLIGGAVTILKEFVSVATAKGIADFFTAQSDVQIIAEILAFMAIILISSCAMAIGIYKKREF